MNDETTLTLFVMTEGSELDRESEIKARDLGFRFIRSRRSPRLEIDFSAHLDSSARDGQRWNSLLRSLTAGAGETRKYRLLISIAETPVELPAPWLHQWADMVDEIWLEVSEPRQRSSGQDKVLVAVDASEERVASLDIVGNDSALRQHAFDHWVDQLPVLLRGWDAKRLSVGLESNWGIVGVVLSGSALSAIKGLGLSCAISIVE